MNGTHRCQCGRSGAVFELSARCWLVAVAANLMTSASGCSSGSGGGASSGEGRGETLSPSHPAPGLRVPGDVIVTVAVRDVSGAPVPGATISVFRQRGTAVSLVADHNGRADIVGDYVDASSVAASATDLYGYSPEPTQVATDRIDFVVTLHPSAGLVGGLTMSVPGGPVKDSA